MSDRVELVEEVERVFGVTLDDDGCSKVVTVGDICDLVLATVSPAKLDRCLSALAFWRLRRAIVECFGVGRARVRPGTTLATLLWPGDPTRSQRREAWTRLERTLGLSLRPLERPSWLVWLCSLACMAVLACGLLVSDGARQRWLSIGLALALGFGLGWVTKPWRADLPSRLLTVGDLALAIVRRHATTFAASAGGFTRAQVEELVPMIISEEQGIPLRKVTLDARIVDDLGID